MYLCARYLLPETHYAKLLILILIIDNYDSFTYNLVDLVARHTAVEVVANDVAHEVWQPLRPAGVLLSPGPGRPSDSGISPAVLRHCVGKIPVLGVCLGHQLIGEFFGGEIRHAAAPVHGKTSDIRHAESGIFAGLPNPLRVMRYHSLLVSEAGLPACLEITARTEAGEIMALQHREHPITGVQFHPESILSEGGAQLIENWLRVCYG